MKLPCRHIFALRRKNGVSLYDKNICAVRWTNSYYRSTHKSLKNLNRATDDDAMNAASGDPTDQNVSVNVSTQVAAKKLSSHAKFSKALDVCKKIANVLSNCSHEHFERKISNLNFIHEAWCKGKEIGIQILADQPGTSCNVEFEANIESETNVEPEANVELGSDVLDDQEIDVGRTENEILNVDFHHAIPSPISDDSETFDIPTQTMPTNNQNRNEFSILNKNVVSVIVTSISDEYEGALAGVNEQNNDDLSFDANPEDYYVIHEIVTALVNTVVSKDSGTNSYAERCVLDEDITFKKIKSFKMPPALKKKGRPKGSDKTNVIGLKKKKKPEGCQKFTEMKTSEKEKFVLLLCVGESVASNVLSNGKRVEEGDIDPTVIDSGVFNEKICLKMIKYLFSDAAWCRFYSFYSDKIEILKFQCAFCLNTDASYDDLITCDHCLKCYHHSCVKLKKSVRKRAAWFCNPCKAVSKSSTESVTNVCDDTNDELENEE